MSARIHHFGNGGQSNGWRNAIIALQKIRKNVIFCLPTIDNDT